MFTIIFGLPQSPPESAEAPALGDVLRELARRFGFGPLFCTADLYLRAAEKPPLKALLLRALGTEKLDPIGLSRWLRRHCDRWACAARGAPALRLTRTIVGGEVRYFIERGRQ